MNATLRVVILSAVFAASTAQATDHPNTNVATVLTDTTRPCVLFNLTDGLAADPVSGSTVWIAVAQSAPFYKERLSMLYMAKLTGTKISVTTDGVVNGACGHVGVSWMNLP